MFGTEPDYHRTDGRIFWRARLGDLQGWTVDERVEPEDGALLCRVSPTVCCADVRVAGLVVLVPWRAVHLQRHAVVLDSRMGRFCYESTPSAAPFVWRDPQTCDGRALRRAWTAACGQQVMLSAQRLTSIMRTGDQQILAWGL